MPIFPEIRAHLQTAFDRAPEGAEFVILRYRSGSNLNPQLRRIVERAGVKPWPRAWHNLRASRQTELAAEFPLATVCSWIGNTKAIAAGHYLQVTDADWTRATGSDESGAKCGAPEARIQAQRATAPSCANPRESSEVVVDASVAQPAATQRDAAQTDLVGRAGLEPATPAFSVRCSTN